MTETREVTLDLSALDAISKAVHDTALEKGWYDDGGRKFPEAVALFHSELSEALEDYRNGHALTDIYYEESGKPCGVAVELADLFIRVLDTCAYEGIPIVEAMAAKIAYNMGREYRHGGKVC